MAPRAASSAGSQRGKFGRRWRDDDHEGADGTGTTGRADRAPASAAGAETTAEGNYAPSGNGSDDSGQLGNDDEPARR